MDLKPTFAYKDVSLVPRNLSTVRSRQEIDLAIKADSNGRQLVLRIPLLPAPMDTICSVAMCRMLAENEMLGMIHRFKSDEDRLNDYRNLQDEGYDAIIAVGLEEEGLISEFHDLGARRFIVDVANGFNQAVEPTIDYLLDLEDTFVICGNVDSGEGFEYLSNLGVHAIRVGIGTGSMCTTSIMTGVGQGIISSIIECRARKDAIGSQSLLIADGGIREVGDIAKALVAGADLVMAGRLFAGTKEAEGNILKYEGKLYKAYRGSASFAVQQKRGKNPYYIEGDETIVAYKGGVQNILDQVEAGLRSSLSYMGARNLEEFTGLQSLVVHHSTDY